MSVSYEKWNEEVEPLGEQLYQKYALSGEMPVLDWNFLEDAERERWIGAAVLFRKQLSADLLTTLDVEDCYGRYAQKHLTLGGLAMPVWEKVPTRVRLCLQAAVGNDSDGGGRSYDAVMETSGCGQTDLWEKGGACG